MGTCDHGSFLCSCWPWPLSCSSSSSPSPQLLLLLLLHLHLLLSQLLLLLHCRRHSCPRSTFSSASLEVLGVEPMKPMKTTMLTTSIMMMEITTRKSTRITTEQNFS